MDENRCAVWRSVTESHPPLTAPSRTRPMATVSQRSWMDEDVPSEQRQLTGGTLDESESESEKSTDDESQKLVRVRRGHRLTATVGMYHD